MAELAISLKARASSVAVWIEFESKDYLNALEKLLPLRHRKAEHEPSEGLQKEHPVYRSPRKLQQENPFGSFPSNTREIYRSQAPGGLQPLRPDIPSSPGTACASRVSMMLWCA